MEKEQSIQELKNKVEDLKKYYFKGFGDIIESIKGWACLYVNDEFKEQREEAKNNMESHFKKVDELYQTIPFDTLVGKSDYEPLFIVKNKLIPRLEKSINMVIEKGTREEFEKMWEVTDEFDKIGKIYRNTFCDAIDKVRKQGEKNYIVIVEDSKKRYYIF